MDNFNNFIFVIYLVFENKNFNVIFIYQCGINKCLNIFLSIDKEGNIRDKLLKFIV